MKIGVMPEIELDEFGQPVYLVHILENEIAVHTHKFSSEFESKQFMDKVFAELQQPKKPWWRFW